MLMESKADIDVSAAQWQTRVDLAAAHRLCVREGFHEGIFNHLTARVPGRDDRYYQIPFGLHWSEVTASSLMEVGYDGKRITGEGYVEESCYCIHAPMHRLLADAAAVFHTHTAANMAVSNHKCGLLPITQHALHFYNAIGYHDFAGFEFDLEGRVRLNRDLEGKLVMLMRNHGALVCGRIAAAISCAACSSNSSASFSVIAPPSSSASTMVTARR